MPADPYAIALNMAAFALNEAANVARLQHNEGRANFAHRLRREVQHELSLVTKPAPPASPMQDAAEKANPPRPLNAHAAALPDNWNQRLRATLLRHDGHRLPLSQAARGLSVPTERLQIAVGDNAWFTLIRSRAGMVVSLTDRGREWTPAT